MINNEIRCQKNKGIFHVLTPAVDAATSATDDTLAIGNETNIHMKGGGPVGTTDTKKNSYEYATLASKN